MENICRSKTSFSRLCKGSICRTIRNWFKLNMREISVDQKLVSVVYGREVSVEQSETGFSWIRKGEVSVEQSKAGLS